MSDLANYSIETDHTVLLSFKDGRRLRVSLGQLAEYLKPTDLAKIKRAVELRRSFIKRHMPKLVLVLVTGSLVALSATATSRVAAWIQHRPAAPAPAPAGDSAQKIVRDLRTATPTVAAPTPLATKRRPLAVQATSHPSAPSSHRSTKANLHVKAAPQVSAPLGSVTLPVSLPVSLPLPTALPLSPILAPQSNEPPSTTPQPDPSPQPLLDQLAPVTK